MFNLKHGAIQLSRRLQITLICFSVSLIVLPVVICIMAYSQSLSFVIEQEMETRSKIADIAMESLEDSLYAADAYASSLMSLSTFQRYFCTSADAARNELLQRMMATFDSLPRLDDSNDILMDFYVYSAASDSLLNARSGYLKPLLYYESNFMLDGFDEVKWYDEILNDRASSRFISAGGEDSFVQLLYSKRLAYIGYNGRILFQLNLQNIADSFQRYGYRGSEETFFLYDRDGVLLYTDADSVLPLYEEYGVFDGYRQISIEGKEGMLCSKTMLSHGLVLYIVTPMRCFTQSAFEISRGVLRGLIVLMLAGVLLTFVLLHSSHEPIRQTLADLPETEGISTINPFKYIQQSTKSLSQKNQRYEEQLQLMRYDLRSAMLSALIYDKTAEGFPLEEKLAEMGVLLHAAHYRGVVLTLYPPDDSAEPLHITNRMHIVVRNFANAYEKEIRYLNMDDPDRIVFLALLEDLPDRMEWLQSALSKLCWEISKTLNCEATAYIGSECEAMISVSSSFRSLRDVQFVRPASGQYIVCAREKNDPPIYDYNSEDEKLLRHLVLAGNEPALCRHLDSIRERNSGVHSRTDFGKQLLYAHMIGTLIRAGWCEGLDEELEYSLSILSVERFFALLGGYYTQLCRRSQDNEAIKRTELVQEILAYIRANFREYNLGLAELSVRFRLPDRRISALVREETGQGLPEFLETLRIDCAMEMLRESDHTIEEIAVSVGYASDKSFRRAFKRHTGESPSAIRARK